MALTAESHLEWLRAAGYDPVVNAQGDVSFRHGRVTLIAAVTASDPTYFRLLLPHFCPLDHTPHDLACATSLVMELNAQRHGVKFLLLPDNVSVVTEAFYAAPGALEPLFGRLIEVLLTSRLEFHERLAQAVQQQRTLKT